MSGTVHASAVLVGQRGVLIRGQSGSGKSSLTLALLAGNDCRLVADDRVRLTASGGRLLAAAPAELAGLLEVRGVGIVRRPHVAEAVIGLVVDLMPAAECPRFPDGEDAVAVIAGIPLERIALPIGIGDGALRVRAALDRGEAKPARPIPLALRNPLVKIAPSPRAGARRGGSRPVPAPPSGKRPRVPTE
jgi:HPr kinase/phosphorylase